MNSDSSDNEHSEFCYDLDKPVELFKDFKTPFFKSEIPSYLSQNKVRPLIHCNPNLGSTTGAIKHTALGANKITREPTRVKPDLHEHDYPRPQAPHRFIDRHRGDSSGLPRDRNKATAIDWPRE